MSKGERERGGMRVIEGERENRERKRERGRRRAEGWGV